MVIVQADASMLMKANSIVRGAAAIAEACGYSRGWMWQKNERGETHKEEMLRLKVIWYAWPKGRRGKKEPVSTFTLLARYMALRNDAIVCPDELHDDCNKDNIDQENK